MNLRVLSWRRLGRRDRPGVRQIRCEPDSGALVPLVRRHGAFDDRYVTVTVDLTPHADGGPARLPDMVPGRSTQVLREWLDTRGNKFRRLVEMVTMDVFAGWKQAVESVPPNAVEAGAPFPIMQLAAARITKVRCRRQARRQGDRLYDCRRTLLTGDEYLGQRDRARLMALFAIEANRDPCSPTTPAKGSWAPTGARIGAARSV